jgi:hypothetical protein
VIVLRGRVGDADRGRSFARGAYDHLKKGLGGGWPDVHEYRSAAALANTRTVLD